MNFKTEFLLPVMILSLSTKTYALDWFYAPGFTYSQRYTDNLRLVVNPNRSNLISTFKPTLRVGYLADNSELKTDFALNQLLYYGESDLNYLEKTVSLNHLYKSEFWQSDITAKYLDESSITSQLGISGAGLISTMVPKVTKQIFPKITFMLSEKNSLELNYNYQDITFNSHPNIAFTNYISQRANAIFNHNFTERFSLNLDLGYALYNAGDTYPNGNITNIFGGQIPTQIAYSQNSETWSYQLGGQYKPWEDTVLTASAGIRDTTTKVGYVTEVVQNNSVLSNLQENYSSNGRIYAASVRRNFERGAVYFNFNQQLSPASTGSQQQTTTFNLSGNINFSERWEAALSALYLESQSISAFTGVTNLSFYNRDLLSLTPNVQWKWTPDISLNLSYTYTHQDYVTVNQTAIADYVMMQFVYQPQPNRQVK